MCSKTKAQYYRGKLLKHINKNLHEEDFKSRNTYGCTGFVRNRILTFQITFLFITQLLQRSIQRELNSFFGKISDSDYSIQKVTKGALTQARAKLKYNGFIELSDSSVEIFYTDAPYLAWDKHRVLACDGSTLQLPNSKSIAEEFGVSGFGPKADVKHSLARISLVYDVFNLVTLNAKIAPFKTHETTLLKEQLSEIKFKENDLLLLDRGYPSIALLYELQQREIDFCVRLKDDWWNEVNQMLQAGETDKIITFTLPKKDIELQEKFNASHHTVIVRLVVIELENGSKEILCTSLVDDSYTLEDLKWLYHKRWNIEEAYKLFKQRANIESFSGKTALSVNQDFYAAIFMMNMCAVMSFPIEQKVRAQSKQNTHQHPKQINRTNALALMNESIVGVFVKKKIKNFLKTLDHILHKTIEIVRPNRREPRNHKIKKPKSMNYKIL